MAKKIILDLCGGTGSWSRPYTKYPEEYDVRVITLPDNDVRDYHPPENVYGILAAPPCTEFAGSGARWWATKDPKLLEEALEVFDSVIRIISEAFWISENLEFWAIENPVGRLKKLRYDVLGEPRLTFHPYEYGDPYTKKTLLWGYFHIPMKSPVKPTNANYIHYLPPSEKRQELRSVTPPGFAKSFFKANR